MTTMPLSRLQMDALYWRGRAEEARAMADSFNDTKAKLAMLDIAMGYDFLRANAERHLAPNKPQV